MNDKLKELQLRIHTIFTPIDSYNLYSTFQIKNVSTVLSCVPSTRIRKFLIAFELNIQNKYVLILCPRRLSEKLVENFDEILKLRNLAKQTCLYVRIIENANILLLSCEKRSQKKNYNNQIVASTPLFNVCTIYNSCT